MESMYAYLVICMINFTENTKDTFTCFADRSIPNRDIYIYRAKVCEDEIRGRYLYLITGEGLVAESPDPYLTCYLTLSEQETNTPDISYLVC